MKVSIDPRIFAMVCGALIASEAKMAVKIIDDKTVVKATWHNKPSGKNSREEMVITFGRPNYQDSDFIKRCKKAGEPFPIKKIQFRPWPKKRIPA